MWVGSRLSNSSKCSQASEIGDYEEDAHITFAILDAVNGNIEDAMTAFESIKNVVSYWNLALVSDVRIEFHFVCLFALKI